MTGRRKRRRHALSASGPAPFVERARELAVLSELLEETKTGRGNLVVITGEPGIGKTRLANHFASELEPPLVATLWGRCHPDPDVPAYWPWKQIIARHAERRDDLDLQRELGAAARDIVPLVPQLALRFPELARPANHEPREARQRVFEGIVAFLQNAARTQPLLIAFDDLQWIDDASLSLLELFANVCSESRCLLVLACRTTDFSDPQTEVRVGALMRRGHHLALNGLNEVGVGKLIRAISGRSASPGLARTLHKTTQGNPLFVDHLTRFIAAHDAWNNVNLGNLGLPRELKLAIQSRLAGLPEQARAILASAAVIGRTSAIDVLARVVDLPMEELLALLHDPIAARILHEVRGSPREYTFAHVLIRDVLYDRLPALEKAQIHRRVAEAILEVRQTNLNDQLSAVAHHFFQAARGGRPEAAVDYCARAGDQALDSFAYEGALGHYRRALIALEYGNMDQRRRCELLLRLGNSQRYAGDAAQAKTTFLEAILGARALLDDELLARGALGFAGAWNAPLHLPDEQVLEQLQDASNRLRGSHPALRARLIARRVHEHWWSLTRAQARAELDEALALAEASGDPNAIAHVLHIRHLALWDHEDLDARLSTAGKIVSLRDTIEKELALEGYSWLMADELESGNIIGFEAARLAHEELARHLHLSDHVGAAQIRRAARDLMKGRVQEAIAACDNPPKEAQGGYHMLGWAFLRFCIHREQGSVQEVEPLVRGVTHAASSWPAMRYWLVCTLATAGSADARLEFEGISANEFRDLPDDLTRLTLLGLAAEACALIGSAEQARLLYAYLLPFAGRHIQFSSAMSYFDSVSHMLARLATQLEDWDSAGEHFAAALRQAQALGTGPRAAHVQFHWALMLLGSGRADQLHRARSLLETTASAARHFGLYGLILEIEAHQHVLGPEQPALAPEEPVSLARPRTTRSPVPIPMENSAYVFRCEGEFWTLRFDRETIRLKDTRGLQLIATLLRSPGTQIHALELATGSESRAFRKSSAGIVLDAKARDAYRKRLQELAREQSEAEEQNDPPRVARARRESELLTQQLATALGIGGRNRRAAAEAERARINVTRSIRSAISRMATKSPVLAHHLSTSIRTGTFCHYVSDPSRQIEWQL